MLEEWEDKEILILGFGKEGKDALNFLRKIFPKKILGIADENESVKKKIKKVRWHLGKDYLRALKKYRIIVKSPGIPPKILKKYIKKNQILTSTTEIFFENCRGKIIGITGTKGKGTCATLIYKILKEANFKVHLVGNIEKPPLKFLFLPTEDRIFVFELSAQQLIFLKKSPQIAVFLNIFPAHLDFFESFKDYVKAKMNIFLYQKEKDFLIYNSSDKILKKLVKKAKSKKIAFDKNLKKNLKKIKPKIPAHHNLFNISAAIEVAKIFKVPKKIYKKVIENFEGLPHRLEFVGKFRGINFYNDSLATIPQATISDLKSFSGKVFTLICGGFDSKVSFSQLAKEILKNKVKCLILFLPTGLKIWREILKIKKIPKIMSFFAKDMEEAVRLAFLVTKKNKICLLSPASPSFGNFRDYKERGNLFKKFVKEYGTKKT
jgi:UDP-N-acetylmuramoylalanine--D-glutamate ligase